MSYDQVLKPETFGLYRLRVFLMYLKLNKYQFKIEDKISLFSGKNKYLFIFLPFRLLFSRSMSQSISGL